MSRPGSGLSQSLALRLLLFLVGTLAVGLAIHGTISWRSSRNQFLSYVRTGAAQYSDLIAKATHDGMLLHRLDEVQDTLERLVSGEAVEAIRIYDKRGVIVLSGHGAEIGTLVATGSPTCNSCHSESSARSEASLEQSSLAHTPLQHEVLRHLSVIENELSCSGAGCHATPQEKRILGVLDVEMSMRPMQAALRADQRRIVGTAGALILVVGIGSAAYIHRVVRRPVRRLRDGTQRIAGGDLQTRIAIEGNHELSQLGQAFNRMAEDLEHARGELQNWSQSLEAKVAAKTDALQRVQQQVLQMEKMASLGKLSATVAHELNNPLSGMLNYTRLVQRELKAEPLTPEAQADVARFLERLQAECVRCGRIVTDLLLFARGHGARMGPASLREIVERSLALVDHHLVMHGVELKRAPFDGDDRFVGDADQLQQALVALLVNAVEAMSGELSQERTLTVTLEAEADAVGFEISDSGVGIAPELLPQIFEPFFSTKGETSGVGLGLAVVYGIVQRHAGTIQVSSELGRGTCVRVRLPRQPSTAVTAEMADQAKQSLPSRPS
jgi:two-component system NtrC family sensor kinase